MNPGHLRAIGLPPGEHLVGDDAQREQVRLRRARLAQKVFGGCVLQGARNAIVEQRLREACAELGLNVTAWFDSPIEGGDGNREFFVSAKKIS